ncbi:MAG: SpoIIE family protein phosphatase [Pseudomonadota bacterium]|nr:SpoIIE family protein phosphatase [Pseudomonadota bacterium]
MLDRSLFADHCALVLEDDPRVRDRLIAALAQLGLTAEPITSTDAVQDLVDQSPPDLIVIGREFAGVDSLDLVRQVRRTDPAHWIPILMLGRDREGSAEVEALQGGCDDYLVHGFDTEVLFAKLTSLMRMRKLRKFSEFQRAELAAFRDRAESEADLARFLLSRLSRVEHLDAVGVAYHWLPAEGFSGDLLAATRSSSGDLYGLLADATGHGLAAAINLIPLTTAFYAMATKGFNLQAISEQLNKVVKDYSLPDRFVAVTLVRFAARERRLEVVNAGNPAALVVDRERRVVREIPSGSIPLGILDRPLFSPKVEAFELAGDEELLVFSDGLIEACNFEGELFGRDRILEAIAEADPAHDGLVLSLQTSLAAHCIGVSPSDDISLMVLRAPEADHHLVPGLPAANEAATAAPVAAPASPDAAQASTRSHPQKRCVVEVSFSSIELQRIDVVPVIVDLTRSIGLRKALESRFFTVLSELYVNALDHGLLALDSSLKAQPDGFERYFGLRSERLASLDDGEITIRLDHRYLREGGGTLQVEVTDTGPGFDHQRCIRALLNPELGDSSIPSGRGLGLLLTLCDKVKFNETGNSVCVDINYG